MTTKDYLKQIQRFEAIIQLKQSEIDRMESLLCSASVSRIDPNKVQTSIKGDKMASGVSKLIDAKNELVGIINLYNEKRNYIISQIDSLPELQSYVVLTDKYVIGKRNCEIACEPSLNCSERRVKQIHQKALKSFEDRYGAEYLDNPTLFS
jgi:hypothetical protein